MAYTSKAQMVTRWGSPEVLRSADRDPQDAAVDDATVEAYCVDASSLVDSYLAKAGYAVPVNPAPAVLTLKATDIAIWLLSYDIGGAFTEVKERRYKNAIAWLEKLADGDVKLPGADADAALPTTSGATSGGTALAYQMTHTRGLV
jgi:phage gp36-like protein